MVCHILSIFLSPDPSCQSPRCSGDCTCDVCWILSTRLYRAAAQWKPGQPLRSSSPLQPSWRLDCASAVLTISSNRSRNLVLDLNRLPQGLTTLPVPRNRIPSQAATQLANIRCWRSSVLEALERCIKPYITTQSRSLPLNKSVRCQKILF